MGRMSAESLPTNGCVSEGSSPGSPKKDGGQKSSAFRWCVRGLFLGVSLVLLLHPKLGVGWLESAPAGVSPLLALAKLRGGQISFLALLGMVLAFVALWWWRPFCRWICPLGTCNELAEKLGGWCRVPRMHLWPVGQVLATAAVMSVVVGLPLFLWLDPLAIWSSPWEASGGRISRLGIMALFGALILIFSFATRGGWCRYLCLVGGLQELLFFGRRLGAQALREWASLFAGRKGGVQPSPLTGDSVVDRNDLPAGGAQKAIPQVHNQRLIRRFFLGVGVAGVAIVLPWPKQTKDSRRLRPPGARQPESSFLNLCVRCGNCIRACPAGILIPDWSPAEWTEFAAPVVRFQADYCHRDCVRCGQVCPTGAIQEIQPSDKLRFPIGKVIVEGEICLLADERECGLCRAHCPYEAIRLRFSWDTYAVLPEVDPSRCNGCGACEVICPTQPRKAIRVEPL